MPLPNHEKTFLVIGPDNYEIVEAESVADDQINEQMSIMGSPCMAIAGNQYDDPETWEQLAERDEAYPFDLMDTFKDYWKLRSEEA